VIVTIDTRLHPCPVASSLASIAPKKRFGCFILGRVHAYDISWDVYKQHFLPHLFVSIRIVRLNPRILDILPCFACLHPLLSWLCSPGMHQRSSTQWIIKIKCVRSTANAAAFSRCPVSITYTTPSGCLALNCLQPTCTVTSTTTIPTSYCRTKTRTACPRSCAPCSTEIVTEQEDPIIVQPTTDPNTTVNPGGPIVTATPSMTASEQCAPYTVTTTATNPGCTFDTSDCIRPMCVIETTTTVPNCGTPITETEIAACATECPAGCGTFIYTTSVAPTSSAALD
jgi:hypothetical protein